MLALSAACGLTVSNKQKKFDDLLPEEKSAATIILEELRAFNTQVKARSAYNIDPIINKDRIDVSFKEMIFAANLGDNLVHISTWENLKPSQRELVQKWFAATSAEGARQIYQTFFYRFIAVVLAVKQYMYEVHSADWVYGVYSVYNLEINSVRVAIAHFASIGRKAEILAVVQPACASIQRLYGPSYAKHYNSKNNNEYYTDNLRALANPEAPNGAMYFICRWLEHGLPKLRDLTTELTWLKDARSRM